MSEQQSSVAVLKINTALSNKPFFIKITDPSMSMDRIFAEAISTLQANGKPLESQQLDQLYHNHQLFNGGKVIQKGDLLRDLELKTQQVGDQHIQVAEMSLVTSHAGGIDEKKPETIEDRLDALRNMKTRVDLLFHTMEVEQENWQLKQTNAKLMLAVHTSVDETNTKALAFNKILLAQEQLIHELQLQLAIAKKEK